MRKTTVTCDACGRDLTTTGNCDDYRVVLKAEPIPSRGSVVTLMAMYPWPERAAHFCGPACLRRWLDAPQEQDDEEGDADA